MTAREAVLGARALLRDETPLKSDCGRLCGRACCVPDENNGNGMLLFPGEETLFAGLPGYALSPSEEIMPGMTLCVCLSPCHREDRPLACRFFPLSPILTDAGADVTLDPRARGLCPLCRQGVKALSGAFVSSAREAARLLAQQEETSAYLIRLTRYLTILRDDTRRLRRDLAAGGVRP